jgi:acyl-CoA reductase-like NAD-dependent aldehyde dehydrogenase
MISEKEAARVERWVAEAVEQGARIAYGGKRDGVMHEPTILVDVKQEMKVVCQEVFGPVVSLLTYDSIDEAIALANDSEFGLQGGVFTKNVDTAFKVAREFEVGGVMINDASSFRVDQMPYGGVKNSGIGREGPRFAIEEMTEMKLVMFNL